VRTYATRDLAPADRNSAREVAGTLLASAGIVLDWRNCDDTADCPDAPGAPRLTLIFMAVMRPACGTAALEPGAASATILIPVPCVADVALAQKRRLSTRSNPLVSTLAPPHLLGAAVAHELGHVLGLSHAPRV
jgi:hypothetical protein